MENVNSIIRDMKPSATLAVGAKATELKAQGKSIIDMSAGEPDIDTPEFIKQAAVQALKDGKTKYTAVNGIAELRAAVAKKFKNDNEIDCEANDVIITNGGKQALHEVLQVCLEKGDEVIIPAPYWVSYPAMVKIAGGVPVIVNATAETSYKLTPAQLKAAITSKTKFVIINSPSNPTGAAYSKAELRALGEVIKESKCLVLSDEVYEKIVFDGFKFYSFAQACPELKDRTVTVNAFSKTYAMTGWRVGYVTGPRDIMAAVSRFQSQTTSNICSIAQYAALAALNGSTDFIQDLIKNYSRRIDLAMDIVQDTPYLSVAARPEGAFYLFIKISDELKKKCPAITDSVTFSTYLIENAGVAVVPGKAFGDDSAFRISTSSSDEHIATGLTRIKECLSKI